MGRQVDDDISDGSRKELRSVHLGQKQAPSFRAVAAGMVLTGIAIFFSAFLLSSHTNIPDASTLTISNYQANIDAGNWVGQSFVAKRDNLDEVSLVLATEQRNDFSAIGLTMREEGPAGTVLRTVKRPISSLPEGKPYDFRPGSVDERWTTFYFDPIANSAGRTLYFEVSGQYVPNVNKVQALMMFQGKYTQGKGYVNGEARNANVVFRTRAIGLVRDYPGVVAENLTAKKQGILAIPTTYVGLGAVYLLLLVILFMSVRQAFRMPSRREFADQADRTGQFDSSDASSSRARL